MRVLDLSSAPGGKSTHLASYLENTGLLVSNEISKKRSKILVENMERFGARNVVVTNESAQGLAKIFPHFFDMIVLDAPCSGEGMFRKDPDAIQYWHPDYPSQCSQLQKEILQDALKMLRPGGELVYSTCTWSPEENEGVVAWLLDHYPQLTLEPIEAINGMQDGIGYPQTKRMYPHRFKGEGQFVAKLKDHSPQLPAKKKKKKSNQNSQNCPSSDQVKLWQSFCQKHLLTDLSGRLEVFGEALYLVPEAFPQTNGLRIARNGLHLGTFKKKRFEPSFALGVALTADEVTQTVSLSPDDFKAYVAGHPISGLDLSNGWYLVTASGNGLGFAKVANGILKNYYPKGLRYA